MEKKNHRIYHVRNDDALLVQLFHDNIYLKILMTTWVFILQILIIHRPTKTTFILLKVFLRLRVYLGYPMRDQDNNYILYFIFTQQLFSILLN